jgi:hypothetical protein
VVPMSISFEIIMMVWFQTIMIKGGAELAAERQEETTLKRPNVHQAQLTPAESGFPSPRSSANGKR